MKESQSRDVTIENLIQRNKDFIIDFIKENPKWQISLQLHKFMNVD